jgi:hypothetical protein
LVSLDDCLLQLLCFLPFLWEWVVDYMVDVSVGPHATLLLHVGGMLAVALLFQIGILIIVQVQAKCPNRQYFRH